MRSYGWDETRKVEIRGEVVLDKIFGKKFLVVRASDTHQRKQKIDRFLINTSDGNLLYKVDYKTDEKAGLYNNLALEDVSVFRDGKVVARGWVHTSIADLFVSYVPEFDTAYMMAVPLVRVFWDEITRTFERKRTSTPPPEGYYETEIFCPPIRWLREKNIIIREFEALGIQGRFDFQRGNK